MLTYFIAIKRLYKKIKSLMHVFIDYKGNNKITKLRTILQRESQNT